MFRCFHTESYSDGDAHTGSYHPLHHARRQTGVQTGYRVSVAMLGISGIGKSHLFDVVNAHYRSRDANDARCHKVDVGGYSPTIGIDMCTFECLYGLGGDRVSSGMQHHVALWTIARRTSTMFCTSQALREYVLAGSDNLGVDSASDHDTEHAPNMKSRVVLWDTSGAEQFVRIINPYVASANVILMLYGADDMDSVRYLRDHWVPRVASIRKQQGSVKVVLLRLSSTSSSRCEESPQRSQRQRVRRCSGRGSSGDEGGRASTVEEIDAHAVRIAKVHLQECPIVCVDLSLASQPHVYDTIAACCAAAQHGM